MNQKVLERGVHRTLITPSFTPWGSTNGSSKESSPCDLHFHLPPQEELPCPDQLRAFPANTAQGGNASDTQVLGHLQL